MKVCPVRKREWSTAKRAANEACSRELLQVICHSRFRRGSRVSAWVLQGQPTTRVDRLARILHTIEDLDRLHFWIGCVCNRSAGSVRIGAQPNQSGSFTPDNERLQARAEQL